MKIDAEIQCRFDSLVKANPDPDSVFRLSLLSEAFRNVMDRHEITYEPAYSFQYAYDGKHKDGKTRKYKLDCGTSTMQYAQSAGNNGFSVSCIHIEPREAQYRMTQVYGGVAPERHLLAMVMIGKNELCIETTWLLHGIEERDTLQRQDTLLTNSRELASYYGIKAKRDSLDSEILKLTGTIQRVNGMIAQSGEGAMCDGISLAAIKEAAEEVLKGRKDLYDAYTHDMHGIIAQNLMRNKIIPYGLWDAVKTATYPGSDAIKKSVDKTIDDYTR
ncbi:MAG: hypothetical protein NT051_01720 [Candidatus Micrarchaeota archaeon]|nr:hypothetical protein [Candidatus Micrarchaeota archaeon]